MPINTGEALHKNVTLIINPFPRDMSRLRENVDRDSTLFTWKLAKRDQVEYFEHVHKRKSAHGAPCNVIVA